MTMDLISRKSVAKKMLYRRDYVGRPSDPDCIIADEPSIPAVPLDKLCEYLNSVIYPCIICKESPGPQCNAKRKGCWEQVLKKWMEGLDAAD